MKKVSILVLVTAITAVLYAACGGGGGTTTFTVGGTLTGLVSGTTVTLQNNGGDSLTLSANADFQFSTALADQADYAVTVVTEPTNQQCFLSNSSGKINAASVTNVGVACRHWTDPENLADHISFGGTDTGNPSVAMDNNGNAIIVWFQNDGTNDQIYKSEYRNGAWTNPSSLADNISPDGQDAFSPKVAMSDNGTAIITWFQSDGTVDQIFKSEYRNGAWTNPTDTNDYISPAGADGSARNPEVAMDSSGNAVISWSQTDAAVSKIYKSEYRLSAWTDPANLADYISPNGGGSADFPTIAMDNNGNSIITWYQSNGSDNQIYKSEYRSGIWDNPDDINDYINPAGTGDSLLPRVAMDDDGNAIIVWYQDPDNTGIYKIYKSEYRSGSWTNPAIGDNISPSGGSAYKPSVAMDDNGNALIAWTQANSGAVQEIFMSQYRNSQWTNPTDNDDYVSLAGLAVYLATVAMDNNDNAILSWTQSDGSKYMVYKGEYRHDAWTFPTDSTGHISPSGTDAIYPVGVAMDDDGNAIITWYQFDGAKYQVYMSEFR